MAIYFDESTKTFYLEGVDTTYAFYINEFGYAEHLYYGKKTAREPLTFTRGLISGRTCAAAVPGLDDAGYSSYQYFATELSFFGNGDYREPTVLVENECGDRLSELLYEGYEILGDKPGISGMPSTRGGETLLLHLKDKTSGFGADLYYTVFEGTGTIARRIIYKNEGNSAVTLRRAYSFAFSLPSQDYELLSLHGAWGRENQIERYPVHFGVSSVDSKRSTSSAALNPFMALLSRGATEERGDAYGVSLIYSSSFVLKAEGTGDGQLLVTGGINDFDFSWALGRGEVFETPEVLLTYSPDGIGGMSRRIHDTVRTHLVNKNFVYKARPIVINNWEGTYMDFDTEKLKAIIDGVRDTGIDTFVLDDGWFGKRDTDESGLGDWVVNEKKLPGGLGIISDYLKDAGMNFGLWFEPEMISPDSDVYRAHPDYAIKAPGRENCLTRHQLVMDITRADVRDYIVESVNKIIDTNDITYVKWDYNRNVTEFYSLGLPKDRQSEFAHRYALGLYDLYERIVKAHPDVMFEGCAGGGARFDLGTLAYFPQIWNSDDTDAEERTLIQYGTSIAYPLSASSCHVSVVPNHQTERVTDMKTRADVAELGAFGYELDASSFDDSDRECVREQIYEYKRCESLVLKGDLYRLESPYEGNFFGFMLVSKDKSFAKMTLYRRMGRPNSTVKRFVARGLDESKKYFVEELGITLSGSTLMNVGLLPKFSAGDFKTATYHIYVE
jgi:alpha-galactosidase